MIARRRVPWVTLTCVAVAAGLAPGLAGALEYDRARVEAGEIWRPITAQAVHWSARMAIADLLAAAILGAAIELRSRRLLILALTSGLLLAGAGVHCLSPGLTRYRGASGVASALFVALALSIAAGSGGRERPAPPRLRTLAVAALGAYALKILFETVTGRALFAGEMAPGVRVAPIVHLAGGLGGAIAFAIERRRTPRQRRAGPTTRSPGSPGGTSGSGRP